MGSGRSSELEALLRAGIAGNDPEVRTALLRLGPEVKTRLARGSSESFDFFAGTVSTLAKIKGSANAEARFDCLYDCAHYFFVGGYTSAAVAIAAHLKLLANMSRNRSLERKAFGFAGIIYNEVGDTCEAVSNQSVAFSIAKELGDKAAEHRALINLGVALMDGGLYLEALPCFQRVAEDREGALTSSEIWSTALSNMAKVYVHLGEFTKGLPLIQKVVAIEGLPNDAPTALKRTLREFIYVQIALELGKLNLARQRAKECSRHARFGGTPRSLVLANIASGLCEIYGGSVEKGLQLLEATAGRKDLEISLRLDTLPALIKAYDAAGRINEALECLEELLRYVRAGREKGIRSLLDAHTAHGTFEVMPDTKDAFQSLRVLEADLRTKIAQREAQSWRTEMFERMAATADLKEEASGEHTYRVGQLSSLLASALGWQSEACLSLELAARLHDIGKIAMPDRILLSTAELKEAERHFIATHTTVGAELLGGSGDPRLKMAEQIARHHHEWWNGEGYPSKLKGKRIPIHARIVALADVFDALTHGRPFSAPWPIDKALDEIRARKGTQFDPELTETFLDLIAKLRVEHPDLDEYLGRAGRNSPFLQARNRIRMMLAEEREQEKTATVEGNETRH